MTTDHRDHVEQLLADYRRSREQLASVHHTLLSISESVTSSDGLVTATVGAQGGLLKLDIAADAYRRHRPTELGELIVRLTGQAAAKAAERASQAMAPVLPAGTDPAALLAGRADLNPAEITPRTSPPDRRDGSHNDGYHDAGGSDDGDSYEDVSWLDGGSSARHRSAGQSGGRSR